MRGVGQFHGCSEGQWLGTTAPIILCAPIPLRHKQRESGRHDKWWRRLNGRACGTAAAPAFFLLNQMCKKLRERKKIQLLLAQR